MQQADPVTTGLQIVPRNRAVDGTASTVVERRRGYAGGMAGVVRREQRKGEKGISSGPSSCTHARSQRERSLASWNVFGSSRRWGLDRRPDLEWRLIARYRQAHKQPKLYLDAVGCQPGAPQSVYVRSASLLHCHSSRSTAEDNVLLNHNFVRHQPTCLPSSNGAQSAAPSAASTGWPHHFLSQAFYLKWH